MSDVLNSIDMLRVGEELDGLFESSLDQTGKVILDKANTRVPYKTGELEQTGHVEKSGPDEVEIIYATTYAAILHAHPEWQYQGGRSARWLEEAIGDASIGEKLGSALRDSWPTE